MPNSFTLLAFASALPLFSLSGVFGPISFGTPAIQVLAQLFPPYYAIVLEQHAFHGFDLSPYGLGFNVLVLCGYAMFLVGLAALVLRRNIVSN